MQAHVHKGRSGRPRPERRCGVAGLSLGFLVWAMPLAASVYSHDYFVDGFFLGSNEPIVGSATTVLAIDTERRPTVRTTVGEDGTVSSRYIWRVALYSIVVSTDFGSISAAFDVELEPFN
jgi:hypothetical protein